MRNYHEQYVIQIDITGANMQDLPGKRHTKKVHHLIILLSMILKCNEIILMMYMYVQIVS